MIFSLVPFNNLLCGLGSSYGWSSTSLANTGEAAAQVLSPLTSRMKARTQKHMRKHARKRAHTHAHTTLK